MIYINGINQTPVAKRSALIRYLKGCLCRMASEHSDAVVNNHDTTDLDKAINIYRQLLKILGEEARQDRNPPRCQFCST